MKKSWGGDFALGQKIDIKWPPWRYNDIIGYYRIIFESSAGAGGNINGIRVEKYLTSKKKIMRGPNRRKGKIWLDDPWFHKKLSVTNNLGHNLKDIVLKVLDDLNREIKKEKIKTKQYFIDVEYHKTLIACLDIAKCQHAQTAILISNQQPKKCKKE